MCTSITLLNKEAMTLNIGAGHKSQRAKLFSSNQSVMSSQIHLCHTGTAVTLTNMLQILAFAVEVQAQWIEQLSSNPRVSSSILNPREATCRGVLGQGTDTP